MCLSEKGVNFGHALGLLKKNLDAEGGLVVKGLLPMRPSYFVVGLWKGKGGALSECH